jgi:two-component system cell cycle sensor histidine kinase/response regulator CckA
MIYLDLILNLSLLVALSVISGFIEQRWTRRTRAGIWMQGVLFGIAGVIGMLHPFKLGPGLIFDGRSVMVSLCALFFGPWSGAIAAAMTIVCRIIIGGVGTIMGVLVILTSATIGLLAYFYLKPSQKPPSTVHLYLFGIAVHLAVLAMTATLPAPLVMATLKRIGLPVILLFPLATILIGKILSDQESTLRFIADLQATKQNLEQDIADRKRIEKALRETQEDYRKLFEDHAAVKLIIDPREGAIVDANLAAEAYYGWSRNELRQMTVQQINTVSPELLRQAMNNVLTHKRVHFEFQHRRADGSIRDVAVFSSRIKMKGADYIHAIIHDISERKKAEEENLKLQTQFMQAQKMESIGRLAGGVAHDFNNMLAVIIGRTELALGTVDAAQPIHDDLEEIRKAANRSADLTRQLLAFARKQTIAPVVLDLNETIEKMLKMLRRMIGEDIELLWRPAINLWAVKMDPAQIDQILANLVVNARDAVSGVGRLTIETGNAEFDESYCETHDGCTPGQYALLAVSDDGCGMDKDTLTQLFEPFFTTKASGKGTGLGLSTVYGIVKQNDGFIDVYSEPNQGTIFKIYMPRAMRPETTGSAKIEQEPARGTETVLLVEDEEPILELGKMILERYGYTVLAAKSPSEALALEKGYRETIHLLITDVVMPEMNGKDLRNRIKALRTEIKTLFVSGYTADVIAHHGVLDDSVEYLQKPFSVRTMATKVRKVLDRKPSPSALSN